MSVFGVFRGVSGAFSKVFKIVSWCFRDYRVLFKILCSVIQDVSGGLRRIQIIFRNFQEIPGHSTGFQDGAFQGIFPGAPNISGTIQNPLEMFLKAVYTSLNKSETFLNTPTLPLCLQTTPKTP